MDTYDQVLVGTDGSPAADRAVDTASRIASKLGVPLAILTAWGEGQSGSGNSQDYEWASGVTDKSEGIAVANGVSDISRLEPAANAAESLIDEANSRDNCLLAVGGTGLTSAMERLSGNVASKLTHHSPVDLLLCCNEGKSVWESVAIATDGSTTATKAVHRGVALARELGLTPKVVTVAKDEDEGQRALSAVVADLGLQDVEVETEVLEGSSATPAKTLVEQSASYDLLVIGNRGMSGPSRLLGSVSNRITHQLPTDLLLVNTTR